MGGFNRHITVGWFCHFILSSFTFFLLALSGYSASTIITIISISLPVTLIASVLPDIDHHNSITNKVSKYVIFVSVLISVALILSLNSERIMINITIINKPIFVFLTVITSIVISVLTVAIFNTYRPSHRGLTHRTSASIIISGAIFVTVWYISDNILLSAIVSGFCLSGYVSHLLIDKCIVFTKVN